ncbi:excinuclease ABC subunit UvrA [Desulfobacterium sp. N47]|uniref:UvrABC system protein A n=1 Tax=uncultured Desulfobacterium sp. TaxID=201089 RepID=E1YKU5_9BACT|nr:UvrABC system protein A [uncultured Desulfobacterium sp.]
MGFDKIIVRGARQHNLKNIDVELPRNKLIVITGLSGSGKSTLAFDTLYAEGQRRYVESLSTYARQFLERMDKPDVDTIEGLSPAIAIEQKTASHNPRSTVGTVTEIFDYLRLLYSTIGTPHCYICQKPITAQSLDQITDSIMALPEGSKITILSPLVSGQKGSYEKLLKQLRKNGFSRVRIDGKIYEIEETDKLDKNIKHTIDVIIDRLVIKESIRNRLADSLELAISQSEGLVTIDVQGEGPILFSEKSACITCGISYPEFTPASFSFNSPQGACSKCDGLGTTPEFDPDLIIPNKELSLRQGAVAIWANRSSLQFNEFLDGLTKHYNVNIYTPYKDLPDDFKKILLYGSGDEQINFYFEQNKRRLSYNKTFEGIIPKLQRQYIESESNQTREEIREYMIFHPCPECNGSRLNKASRSVRVADATISEIAALSVSKASAFFKNLKLDIKKEVISKRIIKEIRERLSFLENVGLSYLTLDRSAYTLSGGESQRIRLATQIGSKLTGVLYVLDEPSIGLHQRDNRRLLSTLLRMRDLGNTVLVVEHDEETILAADFVIDMGPGAGINGGKVVFSGTPDMLVKDDNSLTGLYLSGRRQIEVPKKRRKGNGSNIIIKGALENNLKNIDIEFPLGKFTCVTGVSGSGKSTLVLETLYNILSRKIYNARIQAGAHNSASGLEHIDKVINIDQSPIGRTPRSNPGTYTGLFTYIRELFSRTPDARMRGYKPGRFSFNVKGGRCESCSGDGIIKIEMHFLPDVYVSCDVCHGKRYNRETLEVEYKGENIAGVLDMTVNQGIVFFDRIKNIKTKLTTLADVGLGYIKIGQPATTLSGGEAQRVKLSRELSKKGTGRTVYILDEPTTGLHVDDIQKLLSVLNRLVDSGNTVIVIEHNMDVIKTADHIIDLGPEGGDEGGYIVGTGTPEELSENSASYTGQYLKKILKENGKI